MLDAIKACVADLSRPLAIIFTSFATSWAIVVISYKVENGNDGAIFIAGAFAGVGALYGFRAWENQKATKASAEVEIAKVQTEAGQ